MLYNQEITLELWSPQWGRAHRGKIWPHGMEGVKGHNTDSLEAELYLLESYYNSNELNFIYFYF